MRVGIIDYGVGNLGSVARAFEELRTTTVLIDRPADLHGADCLILPGVGNFSDCAGILNKNSWIQAIREEVVGFEKPLLGICLGMQLLGDTSAEGRDGHSEPTKGLGLIPGKVEHLRTLGCDQRVPHVGWNSITASTPESHLFVGIPPSTDFYFVHSYVFVADRPEDVVAVVHHGIDVTAAVQRGRVWGTQFHPEKSSKAGFRLLKNFIEGPTC